MLYYQPNCNETTYADLGYLTILSIWSIAMNQGNKGDSKSPLQKQNGHHYNPCPKDPAHYS